MVKAVQSNGATRGAIDDPVTGPELLSALADGQLDGAELARALAYAEESEGRATWQVYHLVGDVLRSPELARPAKPDFMAGLRAQLAQEGVAARPQLPTQPEVVAPVMEEAANASVFRWKMVAGFASLAAVAAIGWTSMSTLQDGGALNPAGGAQLVLSPEPGPGGADTAAPGVAVADADTGSQVMIRDPRLDELLAAHKQFGSTSTLQMPAGFLRNATFESPGR